MENRKQIESFLLGWVISTIIFCTTFSFIISIERNNYEKRIQQLENQIIKTK
jgi:uncharacterized membrane protein YciS (DUF1049 family)